MSKKKLNETESAVPTNAAGDGTHLAGLDNNPPAKKKSKKLIPFKMFKRTSSPKG